MNAVVYSAAEKFSIREVPVPKCGERQVLIKVKACGICKTDMHIHQGHFISQFPLIPGHEFSGEVATIGSKVTAFKVGDRVVGDNTVLCGECYYCRRNQPLYCENFYSLGVTGPGGFAEYVLVNQDKVFPICDTLSFDQASFTEPTACAVHGMDRMDIQCGDNVLMFGAGPTGLILAQLLKHGGAGNVVVCARSKFRLDLVEKLGIGIPVQIDTTNETIHEKKIKGLFPKGFDVIIDATGASSVTQSCFKYAKKGSKIVIYGVCNEEDRIHISPYDVFQNEYKIIGSFAQTHCYDRAINALETGIVKVDSLISHRFGLADYAQGLNLVIEGKLNNKVIINP